MQAEYQWFLLPLIGIKTWSNVASFWAHWEWEVRCKADLEEKKLTRDLFAHFNSLYRSVSLPTSWSIEYTLLQLPWSWNKWLTGKKELRPKVARDWVHHFSTKWLIISSSTHWRTPNVAKCFQFTYFVIEVPMLGYRTRAYYGVQKEPSYQYKGVTYRADEMCKLFTTCIRIVIQCSPKPRQGRSLNTQGHLQQFSQAIHRNKNRRIGGVAWEAKKNSLSQIPAIF